MQDFEASDAAGVEPEPEHLRDNRYLRLLLILLVSAAFFEGYGQATVEGIKDEDDARDLLRDAVNLALSMSAHYVANEGRDFILTDRAVDVLEEFKPGYQRHYGLAVGDRVEVVRGEREVAVGEQPGGADPGREQARRAAEAAVLLAHRAKVHLTVD